MAQNLSAGQHILRDVSAAGQQGDGAPLHYQVDPNRLQTALGEGQCQTLGAVHHVVHIPCPGGLGF